MHGGEGLRRHIYGGVGVGRLIVVIHMYLLMEKSLVALFCNGDVSKRNKRTH